MSHRSASDPDAARPAASRAAPLVLLHGFTGSPASWSAVIAALRETSGPGPEIAAPVLPGHGDDVPVERDWNRNVASVTARLQSTGSDGPSDRPARWPVHLVGYSLGARVALAVAVAHPVRVARLTLIGGHPGLATEAERDARRAGDRRWIDLLRQRGIAAFVAEWENHPVFVSQAGLAAEIRERQRRVRLGHRAAGLADSLERMGLGEMPCYRDSFAELAMPVTLVTGERDAKFSALADDLAERVTRIVTRVTVPGCGHNPVLEQPRTIARLLG